MQEIVNESKVAENYDEAVTVQNENISLTFDLRTGISLSSICDKITGNEFLTTPTALFSFSVNCGWDYFSDTSNILGIPGVAVDNKMLSANGRNLTIKCHVNDNVPVAFTIVVNIAAGDIAAVVNTTICNTGNFNIMFKFVNPCIKNLTIPGYYDDPERMLGMIPQEIGGVATLNKGMTLGMAYPDYTTGLPSGMNIMQVANMYDRDGNGGVFFADVAGDLNRDVLPIQFTMRECEVNGVWMKSRIDAGQTINAPEMAIGVNHMGDYRTAIDYYVNAHKQQWKSNAIPAWFKEAGGIWSTGAEGSGGPYQVWKFVDLREQISSFDELPVLYDQAVANGTNLFFLNDYWEGEKAGFPKYWCKGDYIPREDLGGESALIQGIKGIHEKGGKVIMYLDPIMLYYDAALGLKCGKDWAARLQDENFHMILFLYYTMLPTFTSWREHISVVAKRLVEKYDADGIYIDSFGWKFNTTNLKNSVENRKYSFEEWNSAVYSLVDMIKASITKIKPEAIVMCESVSGDLWQHADGGLTSDYSRSAVQNENRIIASPARYGIPQINQFSNGTTMNHLVQVFASGHNLALNYKWKEHSNFIKRLLDIRREYRDAFIYGEQSQFVTGSIEIAAFYYTGSKNTIITMVNVSSVTHRVKIRLQSKETGFFWTDLLIGEVFKDASDYLTVKVGGSESENHGLCVFVKTI